MTYIQRTKSFKKNKASIKCMLIMFLILHLDHLLNGLYKEVQTSGKIYLKNIKFKKHMKLLIKKKVDLINLYFNLKIFMNNLLYLNMLFYVNTLEINTD